MCRKFLLWIAPVMGAVFGRAESIEWTRAHELYLRTEYRESLAVLLPLPNRDAAAL